LNLGVAQLKGTWKPDDTQRRAAWELYVELVTRIAVVPLAGNEGLLREALSSLYALFAITREVLRRYGPQVAMPTRDSEYSLGQIAVAVLNDELRPLLARWHPALEEWEARRPPDSSRVAHEDAWEHARALRAEPAGTRRQPRPHRCRLQRDRQGLPQRWRRLAVYRLLDQPNGQPIDDSGIRRSCDDSTSPPAVGSHLVTGLRRPPASVHAQHGEAPPLVGECNRVGVVTLARDLRLDRSRQPPRLWIPGRG